MTARIIVRQDQSTPAVIKPIYKDRRTFRGGFLKEFDAKKIVPYSLSYYFCPTHNFLEIIIIKYGHDKCENCEIYLMEGRTKHLGIPPVQGEYLKKYKMHEEAEAKKTLARYLKLKAFS